MYAYSLVMSFWLGAIFGSFLNVVGLRFLREESLMPNSYCYQCNRGIKPYDNIPIVSWLALRGQCRHCKAPIHWQYPLVELVTAVLFTATVYQFGITLQTLFLLFLVCNFIVILITDFREQYIYDINSLGLIPVGLLFNFLNLGHVGGSERLSLGATQLAIPHAFFSALFAVLGAFLIFFLLNLFSRLVVGKPGFGEGDTRLLMGIGAYFGLKWMILVFVLSFLIQAGAGIPMLIYQWLRHKAYKTAGFMIGGMALAVVPYGLQMLVHDALLTLLMALLFGGTAMFCALKALKLAKELPMGLTYLPFGPAIVFACLLMLFFGPQIEPVLGRVFGMA